MSIELRHAFRWDCDDCGHRQYIDATVGELPPDDFDAAMEGFFEVPSDAVEIMDDEDASLGAVAMINRVVVRPRTVQCEKCKASFPTKDLEEDDE